MYYCHLRIKVRLFTIVVQMSDSGSDKPLVCLAFRYQFEEARISSPAGIIFSSSSPDLLAFIENFGLMIINILMYFIL